jgi:hypothetical protein
MDKFEMATRVMCDALDRSKNWYNELLAQRWSGKEPSSAAYEKLAGLDREAERAIEVYRRVTLEMAIESLDDTPRF